MMERTEMQVLAVLCLGLLGFLCGRGLDRLEHAREVAPVGFPAGRYLIESADGSEDSWFVDYKTRWYVSPFPRRPEKE